MYEGSFEFSPAIYTTPQQYSETLSSARVRIFYKGGNRNSTFITDEFAQKLVDSLPYTPIKGIFNEDSQDFTDHGGRGVEARRKGRIFGVVPENPNFAWEKHLDEDGVEREYACCDVLLFTALYPEAKQIIDSPESMELYRSSLDGNWQYINGKKWYVFTEGCFLGLQILGESVEPCFEGASFYELQGELTQLLDELHNYNRGGQSVDKVLYKLSDDQKYSMLMDLLNDKVDEDGYRVYTCYITSVYDNYAVAFNYETNQYERIYYTKNDENDSVTIDSRETCYIVDVNEKELNAIKGVYTLHNDSYENLDTDYSALVEENTTYTTKIAELNSSLETANSQLEEANQKVTDSQAALDTVKSEYAVAQESIANLTADVEELSNYKAASEKAKKQAVIDSYSTILSDEVLAQYTENIDNYADDVAIDKELAYELKQTNISLFSRDKKKEVVIPAPAPAEKNAIELALERAKNNR